MSLSDGVEKLLSDPLEHSNSLQDALSMAHCPLRRSWQCHLCWPGWISGHQHGPLHNTTATFVRSLLTSTGADRCPDEQVQYHAL